MPQKIRKAVIPAAGLGTRFLPATKSLPKEMLPIVDVPNIQRIVEEAVRSGITSILVITSGSKKAIEDYFDYDYELEARLKASGKDKEAESVHALGDMAKIFYVRQRTPLGLGHAILCAREFVGNEPFAVLLGDDLVVPEEGEKLATEHLISCFEETGTSIVGVKRVPHEEISKYGSVRAAGGINDDGYPFFLSDLVEKPKPEEAYSDYAVMGRYVLTPDIFDILALQKPGRGGEIQLTDALRVQASAGRIAAAVFPGVRYDIGDRVGYVEAIIDEALRRDDIGPEIRAFIAGKKE